MEQALEEDGVLDVEGPVETEVGPEPRDLFLARQEAREHLRRVARQHADHEEHDDGDPEEGDGRGQEPLRQILAEEAHGPGRAFGAFPQFVGRA